MKTFIFLMLFSSGVHAKALLRDVGVVGLMSHDIFAWDHKTEVNTENGRLDLSTIFDYDNGARWKKGGNPKNGENSPVYTITMQLVAFYKAELKNSTPEVARKKTVVVFHNMIKESYERLSGLEWPTYAIDEKVNNTEQAALRGMHDILPGRVKTFDRPLLKEFALTNFLFAKFRLNEKELNQELKNFDGDYDYEYQNIKIPFTKVVVNLKEVDRKFIEKFSPLRQEDMLSDLARVGKGEIVIQDTFFIHYIGELLSKATCSKNNKWMPETTPCK
jgi:hypothetical protein